MKKLVILDLDGTLLNTISDLGTATNYALQQMGYPTHPIASYNTMVGNGVRKLLERAMPLDERNDDNIEAMREHFREYYDAHLWDHTTVYPGMRELLDELVTRDVKFAVASNKYQSAVDRLIQHFFGDLTWAAVYGQREGVPVKPDPSVVFEVLTDCPTAKDDVLYVGDSGVDMETARRACVESVGVTWGFRSRQELVDGYADHIVDNADDILSLL
jgi:phosphoglycolate phosphatase